MADDAYSPQAIDLMSAAFDAAYDQLEGEPSQAVQLQLARRIMAAVKAGEQDLARLTGIALGEIVMEVLAEDGATLPIPAEPPPSAV